MIKSWVPGQFNAGANLLTVELKDLTFGLIDLGRAFHPYAATALFGLAVVAVITGRYVNLNYTGIHRYYRDRLMESFLPDLQSALDNRTGAAEGPIRRVSRPCVL